MLGIVPIAQSSADEARREIERQLGRRLPDSVARLLQFPGVMEAAASTCTSDAMFPASVQLLEEGMMPGANEDILWLMNENQGVCNWEVSFSAGDDPPVLVGGSLEGGDVTTEYASSVGDFVWAMAWDDRLMSHEPLIQAQADQIDDEILAMLSTRYLERVKTLGWPARENRRYEGQDGLLLTIWSAPDQCDWFIAADQSETLERAIASLRSQSNLEAALWSNDTQGTELLQRLGVGRPTSSGGGSLPGC